MAVPGRLSFSFVHAADLHLDTPFHGVNAVAPRVAEALREASLEAFDAIVDLAIAREAAFLLVAGDVYDGAERGLRRAQLRFRDGLERLSRGGISSFVVHGNHDPVETGWSAIGSWPERTTIFRSSEVGVVAVERDGEQIATVQGISYATVEMTENLALRFSRPPGDGLAIGLLHCNVQGSSVGYANYSPCTLDDLRRTGLDYLALGHIHERRVLLGSPGSGPWVVYPGNIQARSPRRSEEEPKGAVVVQVVDGSVELVEFVACDRVRFDELDRGLAGLSDLGEVLDRLISLGETCLERADGRSLVLRARLTGRSELHADLARPGALDELLRALRDTSDSATPFIWWDAVRDESANAVDLAAIRERGDFASDLLEISETLGSEPGELDALARTIASEAPRALDGPLARLVDDDAALRALFERATLLALDELSNETS